MTAEEPIPRLNNLRDALAEYGASIDNVHGPVTEHWSDEYIGCLGYFSLEFVDHSNPHVDYVDAWIVVIQSDGKVLTKYQGKIVAIIQEWAAGFVTFE
jgi:hypothetical protein